MPPRQLSNAEARAIAAEEEAYFDQWTEQDRLDQMREAAIDNHYAKVPKSQLVTMWATARNEKGKPLSEFEFQALCSAWYVAFGNLPAEDLGKEEPDDGKAAEIEASPDQVSPLEIEERMYSPKEFAHITGVSVSTLKRMVQDKRLPEPSRVSPRRRAWPAPVLRDFLAKNGVRNVTRPR